MKSKCSKTLRRRKMDDYIFIYKNAQGAFNTATNPRFIAKHPQCRAIPKDALTKSFDTWSDFIFELNSYHTSIEALTIVNKTDLKELYKETR